MNALTRQAPRRSDAWVIGRRETVRVDGAQTKVVATRGRSRVDVALVLAIGLAITGIGGALMLGPLMMHEGCCGSKETRTKIKLSQMMQEALPQWALEHPDRRCPVSLGELMPFLNARDPNDSWGHRIELYCGVALSSDRLAVWARSAGPDGELATDDDIVLPD
jgi:hypothetical protein